MLHARKRAVVRTAALTRLFRAVKIRSPPFLVETNECMDERMMRDDSCEPERFHFRFELLIRNVEPGVAVSIDGWDCLPDEIRETFECLVYFHDDLLYEMVEAEGMATFDFMPRSIVPPFESYQASLIFFIALSHSRQQTPPSFQCE